MASQFGWLAVGLAIVPLGVVLASQWLWKESHEIALVSTWFSRFPEINSQLYLTKCSQTFQILVGDPISSTQKFIIRSGLFYLIILLLLYVVFNVYYSKLDFLLLLPSQLDDFVEITVSIISGYLIFLFCLSQSILFLDLCKSSRSSVQVFYALIADILLTFTAVAIFSGIIDTSYAWSVYEHEKRSISLEIQPMGKAIKALTRLELSSAATEAELSPSEMQNLVNFFNSITTAKVLKEWPIKFSRIYHKKSMMVLQKEGSEFDLFFQFKGYKRLSDTIEIETGRLNLDKSLRAPTIDIIGRMKVLKNSCSPFTIQDITIQKPSEKGKEGSVYVNANVIPNLSAIDFGKMLRESIAFQLQKKWYAIVSGSVYDMDRNAIHDIRHLSILTDKCYQLYTKADQISLFRDDIFSQSFYNELNSNRSPFWNFSMSSSYFAFACFLTSMLLIFVMIGLLFVNVYNLSSQISTKIFSFEILENVSLERRSTANAVVLGIMIFCTICILKGLIIIMFG